MPDNSIQIRFLEAVKKLQLKFPVAEIAERTGIGQPTVSNYINSKRPVSDNFLKTFCEVFGFDYQRIRYGGTQLLAGNENAPEESEDFRAKYIRQLEKENQYLQEIVKTNLTLVLATVRTLSVRQRAVGEVMLDSLERLELEVKPKKKATGAFVELADKNIDQIEREAHGYDNVAATSR